MKTVEKKCPLVRFKGFTDDWEQRKLGDLSEKVTQKNVNRIYTETFTNSAEYGIVSQRDFFDKDISNDANLDGYYVVENGDFVYNPRISATAPVGPIKRNKLGRTGVMSPLYYVFRTHDIVDKYLEIYYTTTGWHIFMKLNGDSGARADRFAIKDAIFNEMPIPYPTNKEQNCIGLFFQHFNKYITLYQRKLDQLTSFKKAMLGKMFPQEGERVPEVRFFGFTDDWKQRKLGDIAEKITVGIATSSSQFFVGKGQGVFLIKNQNIKISGIDLENLEEISCEFDKANINKRLKANDIITVRTGYPGLSAVVPSVLEGAQTFTTLITRLSKDIARPEFVVLFINSDSGMMQISGMQAGGAQKNVNASILKNLVVIMPDKDEQEKISKLFKKVDNLITHYQHKLTVLQQAKQSFLQKMFI